MLQSICEFPSTFALREDSEAKCDVCNTQARRFGLFEGCEKKHKNCGTCFTEHSFNEDDMIFECPCCVVERKNRKLCSEEVSSIASEEAGVREGEATEGSDVLLCDTPHVTVKPKEIRISFSNSASGSSSGSRALQIPVRPPEVSFSSISSRGRLKMSLGGVETEYVRAKEFGDCDECKSALCLDCVWELPPDISRRLSMNEDKTSSYDSGTTVR